MDNSQDDIFTIKARRCKRCGGLLTSKQAVEDGYGHVCKMKAEAEIRAAQPDPNQISLLMPLRQKKKIIKYWRI